MKKAKTTTQNKQSLRSYMRRYWTLYMLMLLPMIFFIVFRYVPMTYIQIAFKDYKLMVSPWEMEWADNHGFEYFIRAFSNKDFWRALRNTLTLNVLDLLVGFPAPIILAIVLNECKFTKFKKLTQTVAYMPHFLSWVIIAGLALQLFAPSGGIVNNMLKQFGIGPINFLNENTNWVITYVMLGVWQSVGWNTIIYLAAITSINPELYEAASVDGANRLQRIWHITLPGIRSTIVTLLIMNLGKILDSNFERPFALRNDLVTEVSDVISIFTYVHGVRGLQFSLTTAVGLFQSVICIIFLVASNSIAKKLGERGIY